jgi:hypothetical protein
LPADAPDRILGRSAGLVSDTTRVSDTRKKKPATGGEADLAPGAGEPGSAIAPVVRPAGELVADVAAIGALTEGYAARARAANTRRAYRADWAHLASWAARYGAELLPADPRLVARYLSAHAGALR